MEGPLAKLYVVTKWPNLKVRRLTEVAGEGGPDLAVGTIKIFEVPNLDHPLLQPHLSSVEQLFISRFQPNDYLNESVR